MLTSQSLAEFAIIEYNRDGAFRKLVDERVAELLKSGAVRPGYPLRMILEEEIDGCPRAKLLLEEHHDGQAEPQWKRLRQAS